MTDVMCTDTCVLAKPLDFNTA